MLLGAIRNSHSTEPDSLDSISGMYENWKADQSADMLLLHIYVPEYIPSDVLERSREKSGGMEEECGARLSAAWVGGNAGFAFAR